MATQQTFLSPGFFPREIDKSAPTPQGPVGVPAGVIGTANRGPAFVPVTVGNFNQFNQVFGNLDVNRFGPYAAYFFLANRNSLTFLRLLGAGANATLTDIARTQATGRTLNAGFRVNGTLATADALGRHNGAVQFLVAQHTLQANEAYGPAIFTDNNSFSGTTVRLVRGMVLLASSARLMVTDGNKDLSTPGLISGLNDTGNMTGSPAYFKLIISSTLGSSYFNDDKNAGVHIITASFNPDDQNYYAKLLNQNPDNFGSAQHLLYADFPVDDQVATAVVAGVLSGTTNTSGVSQDSTYTGAPYNDLTAFRAAYGAFDARFQTPITPYIISQPFGATEYDLFAVQALDDGQYANNLYKISIVNIQASLNPAYQYGTFTLQVRDWNDNDLNPNILEQFSNMTLDPNADNFVGKVIGDRHVTYNFDSTVPTERRLVNSGKYPNQSSYVRVVVTDAVNKGLLPPTALPFGFHGQPVLKTNDTLTDAGVNVGGIVRINGILSSSVPAMSGAIVPPIPYRSKVTKGARPSPSLWFGLPAGTEVVSPLYYWGTQFERLDNVLDPNNEVAHNKLLSSYTQFLGISLLDVLVTGSGADTLNNNKFSLSKVCFSNANLTDITASVDTHMREAAYIRNAVIDTTNYTFNDHVLPNPRLTFATILGKGTPQAFNRFVPYLKFTTFMAGGWDGVNYLDPQARRMNDQSTCFTAGGGMAAGDYVSPGLTTNVCGVGQSNSTVASYVAALNIMTDPMTVNHNLLAVPGIREPFLTDYAGQQVRNYGMAYYVMDIEKFDENANRLYDTSTVRPDVNQTSNGIATRAIDNSYVGTYFPDVFIQDTVNNRRLKVPASIAAMGALGFNDRVGYPWFAPAGFNRAALDFVTNVEVRLNSNDRDQLYSNHINPIASFPRQGFVIFGQKTLQQRSSALDRVNVRRLLLEVKRIISNIALKIEFEQNTPDVRNSFVAQAVLQLGLIQAQAGIEAFQVIMDASNNTQADNDQNRLNGKVVIVPTRTVEFISVDFVITNSGVAFV